MNKPHEDFKTPGLTADYDPSVERTLLTIVADAATNGGQFKLKLASGIRTIRQIDLVSWFVSGVPLTSGVPNYDYLTVRMGKITPSIISRTDIPTGIQLPLTGANQRETYAGGLPIYRGDQPTSIDLNDRWTLLKPDGTIASSTDYNTFIMVLSVFVDRSDGN